MIAQDFFELLVCPVCKKPLVFKVDPEALKCNECNRVYAVRNNIPNMLVDQATTEPS
ncbi:MAG TPA: Trm112 family protein [Terriglobales bacterium]|nr:Trm112 family protein [Terriglobales bacterium]